MMNDEQTPEQTTTNPRHISIKLWNNLGGSKYEVFMNTLYYPALYVYWGLLGGAWDSESHNYHSNYHSNYYDSSRIRKGENHGEWMADNKWMLPKEVRDYIGEHLEDLFLLVELREKDEVVLQAED